MAQTTISGGRKGGTYNIGGKGSKKDEEENRRYLYPNVGRLIWNKVTKNQAQKQRKKVIKNLIKVTLSV